jgi:hypothetical protein
MTGPIPLARQAARSLTTAAESHRSLKRYCSDQDLLIQSVSVSPDTSADLISKIADVEADLANVAAQVQQSQALLRELVGPRHDGTAAAAGRLLRTAIENAEICCTEHAREALQAGSTTVALVDLLDLEDQIQRAIEIMEQRNLFVEEEGARAARKAAWEAHNQRVVAYLETLDPGTPEL